MRVGSEGGQVGGTKWAQRRRVELVGIMGMELGK